MRIFEKCIYKAEIPHSIRNIIDSDQLAYRGPQYHNGLDQVSMYLIEMVGKWCRIRESFFV